MADETVITETAPATETTPDLSSSMESGWSEAEAQATAQVAETQPVESQPAGESPVEIDPNILAALDPDKLPKDTLEKFFHKFQPNMEKRRQEFESERLKLAAEKDSLANKVLEAFAERNRGPAPPPLEQQVREAIENNDLPRAISLMNAPLAREVAEIKNVTLMRNALETATKMDPDIAVPENQTQIHEFLNANPTVLKMAQNPNQAPFVLRGIMADIRANRLAAELKNTKAATDAAIKAGVEKALAERKALAEKLGPGGSKGGTSVSPGAITPGDMDIDDSMAAGWNTAGLG